MQKKEKLEFVVSAYPVDISSLLTILSCNNRKIGILRYVNLEYNHVIKNILHALFCWDKYCVTHDNQYRDEFLKQAHWLVEQEARIGDASGWPISFYHPVVHKQVICLSALIQGCGISVLVRAYQISLDDVFLELAHRVVRTFEKDIFDGGVSTPIGEDGIFFEEVAVYPANHALTGFIFALFGLYDYRALTDSIQIKQLIHHALKTMHDLLQEYDAGFWTRSELLHRKFASPSHLALQATLLDALAKYSNCEHCSNLADQWRSYQWKSGSRLRYWIASRCSNYGHNLLSSIQTAIFSKSQTSSFVRACISLPDFPVTGGVLTVLESIAQVTKDIWQIEYLTHYVGPNPEKFVIHRFGTPKMAYWQFPMVWLYALSGCRKLISLMHQGASYQSIFPQDGVYTAAFSSVAAKLAGARVVCIDHGHLTLLKSRAYRAERIKILANRKWFHRILSRFRYIWYWPSLYLLAWIAARFVDHYLVPGVAGDGLEEICRDLGVPASRITRFASMIDVDSHVVPDAEAKVKIRENNDIASDAIVIAIICRLAPEKGLDIALESIHHTLRALSPDLRARLRVVIAGDGPLRGQIEEDIHRRGLSQTFLLWGEATRSEVLTLLGISDIFLYTSNRGACFAMAILEAMASSCAVVASTRPISNSSLLNDGRGIAVPPDDVEQTTQALLRLVNDIELCYQMGRSARNYIAIHHSPAKFRQTLMRVTNWSALDKFILDKKGETIREEREI